MIKLKITFLVAKHEFKAFQENGLKLFIFFYTFILLGVWGTNYVQLTAASAKNKQAEEIIDSEWKDQNRNNHSAAHWGTFLFKPVSYLSLLESGTNVYSENQYRVEAHKRPQMHSYRLPDLEAFMRRPDLNTAFFFQWFMPLIIIGLGFSSVSSEREKGFLKVLSVQGASFGQLLAGKFMALYTATLMFIVPPLVIMVAGLIFEGEPVSYLIRAGYWIILYAVYFLLVSGGVLLISALSRSSWSSLMANITVWVFSVLLIPKFSTSVADNLYPLPSYHEFEHNVKTGFDKGLGNDGDYTSRSENYLKKHLNQFNATSIDQLPEKVRFALDLVQAEAYENKVNAFYSKKVEGKFNQQQKFMDYMGLINPFMAVRQLSMAFTGTDVQHHIDFFNKAEEYRNNMMNRLNKRELEIAVSGKLKVNNQDFYSRFPDFNYRYPAVGSIICNHTIAILSLLLWTLILIFSFRLIIKRNNF
ncbi:DUF3526 domain-containing protein [Elizabethkingia miricola]|uniref:DUF3526 domain-containing protein n=1 Tax=Elizabethkingia bruuniana TaxID=1756149 RepID=A0A7T7ZWK5_9FLAO|nr:DUF3526 domain-containing protein [Elizabethkingia bruuniana]KGO08097.1 hypothetical protein KS04_22210 [Elizabethkingia miricola]AQX84326.1 hypothetical protein AYC65_04510 [Elizabethkingia bruuniana]KUY27780.1 hypothetical protein ATB97_16510 [Elizabethkingia bruuniana]OPB64744.1 hypothetical protein BAY12_08150 [Elizabethkingia bruuniana]OPC55294.1 hypothetical protein BAY07_17775 [Elizabethkingia bruuniana]